MKNIENLNLTPVQRNALFELRETLLNSFEIEAITIYGSFSRGDSDFESDIDLLILTTNYMERNKKHEITDIVFEINLKYDTNISSLVLDKNSWEEGVFSILPLKSEIARDGVNL
jgi:uncharacterized protein